MQKYSSVLTFMAECWCWQTKSKHMQIHPETHTHTYTYTAKTCKWADTCMYVCVRFCLCCRLGHSLVSGQDSTQRKKCNNNSKYKQHEGKQQQRLFRKVKIVECNLSKVTENQGWAESVVGEEAKSAAAEKLFAPQAKNKSTIETKRWKIKH